MTECVVNGGCMVERQGSVVGPRLRLIIGSPGEGYEFCRQANGGVVVVVQLTVANQEPKIIPWLNACTVFG